MPCLHLMAALSIAHHTRAVSSPFHGNTYRGTHIRARSPGGLTAWPGDLALNPNPAGPHKAHTCVKLDRSMHAPQYAMFIHLAMMLSAVNGWGLPSDGEAHGHNPVHDDSAPQGRRLGCGGALDKSCDEGCDRGVWGWGPTCDDSCDLCDDLRCACGWFHAQGQGDARG